MELDKRIMKGKRPLTCFDIDEARMYVGEKCYISSNYDFFRNLDFTQQKILNGVEDCEMPFHYDSDSDKQAEFCLPCDWVKPEEPEKKYRPFSLNEFLCRYAISDLISYRIKDCEVVEQSMFIGFQSNDDEEDIPGNGYVLIGNCRYSLKELFNNYDLKAGGEWQPFGIEVKEQE